MIEIRKVLRNLVSKRKKEKNIKNRNKQKTGNKLDAMNTRGTLYSKMVKYSLSLRYCGLLVEVDWSQNNYQYIYRHLEHKE